MLKNLDKALPNGPWLLNTQEGRRELPIGETRKTENNKQRNTQFEFLPKSKQTGSITIFLR